jgi:hypothetical protein
MDICQPSLSAALAALAASCARTQVAMHTAKANVDNLLIILPIMTAFAEEPI